MDSLTQVTVAATLGSEGSRVAPAVWSSAAAVAGLVASDAPVAALVASAVLAVTAFPGGAIPTLVADWWLPLEPALPMVWTLPAVQVKGRVAAVAALSLTIDALH